MPASHIIKQKSLKVVLVTIKYKAFYLITMLIRWCRSYGNKNGEQAQASIVMAADSETISINVRMDELWN
jgi:hypothetical protein